MLSFNFICLHNYVYYSPNTQGFPSRYFSIYLFRNKVHPLNIYHSNRNIIALILKSPALLLITTPSPPFLSAFTSTSLVTILDAICTCVLSIFKEHHQYLQSPLVAETFGISLSSVNCTPWPCKRRSAITLSLCEALESC